MEGFPLTNRVLRIFYLDALLLELDLGREPDPGERWAIESELNFLPTQLAHATFQPADGLSLEKVLQEIETERRLMQIGELENIISTWRPSVRDMVAESIVSAKEEVGRGCMSSSVYESLRKTLISRISSLSRPVPKRVSWSEVLRNLRLKDFFIS